MCGSPASSGMPVAERSPDTAQLFEPAGSGPKADHLPDLRDLRGQLQRVARPRHAGLGHHRVAARVLGLEPGDLLGADQVHQLGAEQLGLHVGGEAERDDLADRQAVGRRPGLGVDAQQLELDAAGRASRRTRHSRRRHRPRGSPAPAGDGGYLGLRTAAHAQRAQQPVGARGPAPGELRQAPGRDAPVQLELEGRSCAMQKPCAKQRSSTVRASIRGTPSASRAIVTGALSPLTAIDPRVFGSGARNSRCHKPSEAAPADARAATPLPFSRPATPAILPRQASAPSKAGLAPTRWWPWCSTAWVSVASLLVMVR